MVDSQLRELLVCPQCHGELEFENEWIVCPACGFRYAVDGRVPIMIAGPSNDGFGHDLYNAQLRGNFFEQVFHTNRINTLIHLITDELHMPPHARILDVGCNTGPMLIPLRRRGYDVTGIDISLDDVRQAERYLDGQELPSDRLSVADGTRLPFRDHSFDLILLVDILEHTDYPEQIVAQVRRLLTADGLVVATVPWAYHPYVRFTWLRKLLSSRTTIDEHPDAPFRLEMLQALFPSDFEPVLFRLVFHWVCILGIYRLAGEPADVAPNVRIVQRTSTPAVIEEPVSRP
jgi:SAM-dependent methyltransferase